MVQPVEMNFLFQLFNVRVDGGAEIADASLVLRGATQPLLLLLVGAIVIVAVVFAYRQLSEDVSPARRYLLAGLRIAFLALALFLLLRPTLVLTLEGRVRRTLLMLFDGSASMAIRDGKATRHENLKSIFKTHQVSLERLERRYDLAAFQFGEGLEELISSNRYGWVDRLSTNSPVTALGEAVREVITRKRGQPLAGIFLVSDGANNAGTSPREVASLAGQENVPIYVYGVGREMPKDVIVGSLFAPELAFADDEVPVTVRVRGQGLAQRTARLTLSLGTEVVAQHDITFAGDTEQVVNLTFTPKQKGEHELTASVQPFADELVKDNNSRKQRIRVIDAKIKVLLVEQAPRWEWRYLQAMLLRDRRVELKCVLLEGDPGIAAGEGSPYLQEFPKNREDLLKYDLVIFGDVDPKALTPTQIETLGQFVSDFGGGLLAIAGKRFTPYAYRRTVLERMLPVEFDPATSDGISDPVANVPVKLELTAAGKQSPMLRLSDKLDENFARWAALPPIFWVSRVSRAKPAAEVLLVDADPNKASRGGKMPVVAIHQYGMGRVMFVGTDNTWRWRRNQGDTYYQTFWGQIVQQMALTHLLGGAKRTQLSANRQNFSTGDRVTIYARLYTASFEPVNETLVRGYFAPRESTATGTEVLLRPLPDQAGMYRGEFVAPAPGNYKFHLDRDQATQLDFNVLAPQFEMGDTAMDEALLKDMAKLSGGQYLREDDLRRLPEIIGRRSDKVASTQEVEVWSSPVCFLLLLALAATEWILRKLSQLK